MTIEQFSSLDITEAVWCVSLWRGTDGRLIRQICPATDVDWDTMNIDRYRRRYTLNLDAEILAAASDTCPILDGRVVDDVTGEGIEGVYVLLQAGGGGDAYTDEAGGYSLHMRAGLPSGSLDFLMKGYVQARAEIMADLMSRGDNRYSLETRLQLEDR